MTGLVPVIPILWSAAFQTIGITGTSPVMTWEGHDTVAGQLSSSHPPVMAGPDPAIPIP
jgi:hypothetical protein